VLYHNASLRVVR
jgi:acyl-CoA reductase-like NAD-dependent aldehyde dehydrogenase